MFEECKDKLVEEWKNFEMFKEKEAEKRRLSREGAKGNCLRRFASVYSIVTHIALELTQVAH